MRAQVEIITPAFARQLLEQNCANRAISENTVLRYAQDMKDGRWQANGQGIVLTEAGMLLDGQHRMHAVIRAGVPVSMLVVRGVDQDAFITMDTGKARSLSDVLSIEGYQHTTVLAAIARAAFNYVAGVNLRYNPSKATLEAFVREHPYLVEIARKLDNLKGLKVPKGPLGAVLFLANRARQFDVEVDHFIDAVATGAGLYKGDARLTLREWTINQREAGVAMRTDLFFGAVARAWNAYARGEGLSVIKMVSNGVRRASLPIAGFKRQDYPDVTDIAEIPPRAPVRSNLPKSLATPPAEVG